MTHRNNPLPCAIDGCDKPQRNRQWCSAHYERWRVHGSPTYAKWESVEQRFWSKVDKRGDDECWLWTGTMHNVTGYGVFSVNYKSEQAHRYSYELATGESLGALQVDHVCFTRRCVNPAHLRSVTKKQNMEHRPGAQRNNLSCGVRGVTWSKADRRWVAQVHHNGKNYNAGSFTTIDEAAEAARLKRIELFTHNNVDRAVG